MSVHFKNTAWGGGGELDPSKELTANNLSRGSGLLFAVSKQVTVFLRAFIQNYCLCDFTKLWLVQMFASSCLYSTTDSYYSDDYSTADPRLDLISSARYLQLVPLSPSWEKQNITALFLCDCQRIRIKNCLSTNGVLKNNYGLLLISNLLSYWYWINAEATRKGEHCNLPFYLLKLLRQLRW